VQAWDSGLGGVHKQIAASDGRRLHVLAGPGTGKTFALMRRVARLLESQVPPERILALSFTRTAAEDLLDQLLKLETPGADKVTACTLHSLCFRILAKEEAFGYTQRVPRPMLSHEVDQLFEDLAGGFGGKRKVKKLLGAYEAAWARLQHEVPGPPPDEEAQAFQAALLDWMRFHKCMLVGELVPLTLDFVRNNPALQLIPIFDHVLVDEYQDLNRADQALILQLAANGHLLVVGDDNQSIYSFRHANPEGIRLFTAEHGPCETFQLTECRRCPPNVVELSNALIANDSDRSRDVPLQPDSRLPSANLWFVQHADMDQEAATAADFIAAYLTRNAGLPPGQVLVLAPRRAFGNAIKEALIARGLNALSYFTEDLLKTEEAATGFTLLTLAAKANDRAAIRAWLGLGASAGGYASSYARLRTHCEKTGVDIKDCLDAMARGDLVIRHTQALVQRWRELGVRLLALEGLSPLDAARAVWPAEATEARDIRLIAESLALQAETLSALVEDLKEVITQPTLPKADGNIIRVMSLHKSKGLTATLVVVVGCVAGALPTIDDTASAEAQKWQRDEQRRLFYVAITRATRTLVLSASVHVPAPVAYRAHVPMVRRVARNGQVFAQLAMTPFLSELGPSAPAVILGTDWRRLDGF
jgi:DNA helicase II / ATP-dependent DNA helicase PcrA